MILNLADKDPDQQNSTGWLRFKIGISRKKVSNLFLFCFEQGRENEVTLEKLQLSTEYGAGGPDIPT